VDEPRPPGSPSTVFPIWSHRTRQSFRKPALTSPPAFALLHSLSPSNASILTAGGGESPIRTIANRKQKTP